MEWYKLFWGTLSIVVVGGAALYLNKRKFNISFDSYCKACINEAKKVIDNKSSQDVVKSILVFNSENSKDVYPIIYRRYVDGSVKKVRINADPFPFDSCPDELKTSIKNGEYIINI